MDQYRLKEVIYHLQRVFKANRLDEFIRNYTIFNDMSEMLGELRNMK